MDHHLMSGGDRGIHKRMHRRSGNGTIFLTPAARLP